MKNFLVLFVAFSLISLLACSQKNPPENVKKEFSQKFVGAKSVKWDSEKENEWEAEFKLNGKEMSACYDNLAAWTGTETAISEKELPAEVANTLKTEFAGYKKSQIEIYESPEIKGFELVLKKGETSFEVIFDNAGKVIRKTDVSKENEEDEKEEK
jgi:membrane-bound lytic murein transglycosylase B